AGLDPTAIIGGKVISFKSNAKLGEGEFMVAEADESDRSFLKLTPSIGVITNIDPEHMENYADFDDMKRSYVEFANKVPFYGSAVCCNDHPVVREIIPQITRKVITYGKADADYCYKDIVQSEENIFFTAMKGDKELGKVKLPMVGIHNAANATAAIAVADELGVDFGDTLKALRSFKGIARRFQILSRRGPIVVDDYAHHPVEIGVTMNAARECWPDHRLTAIFQPHRFTRFAANFDGFIEALRPADRLLVTEVYAAGEAEIEGVNSLKFVDKFKKIFPSKEVKYIVEEGDVVKECLSCNQSQEVMLFLGAGSVTKMAAKVAKSI
ncbi:MAG: Mur ligase family protein, partial [Pseudomonadota bacterium]